MASKAVNLEKQVECPICLEQYKEPKVLSCLHSYCKSCLQKYVKKTKDKQHTITCPECRQETQVPNGDVGKLQGNFWVNNFMSLLSISSSDENKKPLICENCDSGDTAVSRCTECCVFMCDFCVTAHRRMHAFKNHQIVPLEKVKSGSPKALIKPVYCEKHGGEVLKLFCQTCDKPICRDCTIVDHQGHKYAFVADVATKEKEDVRKLLEKTKSKAPALANGVKSVEEMEKRVKAKEKAVAQEINALKIKQVRALEEIFANIQTKAKTISQKKVKQLEAQREGLMIALASVNNSVDFTERTLKDGGDVEVLSMKKQLVTNLSKLSSSTWDCEPCEEDTFQLTVHQDIRQVAANIVTVDDIYAVPEQCTISMKEDEPGVIYSTLAGQRREFTVVVWDNYGKQRKGQKVWVSIIGPDKRGKDQRSDIQVTDNRDGSYSFSFLPKQQGCYQLRVRVSRHDIPGSPFQWYVVPPVLIPKPNTQSTSHHQPFNQGFNLCADQGMIVGQFDHSHQAYYRNEDEYEYVQSRKAAAEKGIADHKGVLSIGVSACSAPQGGLFGHSHQELMYDLNGLAYYLQSTKAVPASHADGEPLSRVTINQGTLSWKVKVICQKFTPVDNTRKAHHRGHYNPNPQTPNQSWVTKSTGECAVGSNNSGWRNLDQLESWQSGDVFTLFLDMNRSKLVIQNLRTSETAKFDNIQGTVSPCLYPDDSSVFSLDV